MKVKDGFKKISSDDMDEWNLEYEGLKDADDAERFSCDMSLSSLGVIVNRKLDKLRSEMLIDDPMLVLGGHYEKL